MHDGSNALPALRKFCSCQTPNHPIFRPILQICLMWETSPSYPIIKLGPRVFSLLLMPFLHFHWALQCYRHQLTLPGVFPLLLSNHPLTLIQSRQRPFSLAPPPSPELQGAGGCCPSHLPLHSRHSHPSLLCHAAPHSWQPE